MLCLVTQSRPTFCDPMECRPPGFSLHGALQTRILEWVAMPSSRGSSRPRDGSQATHTAGKFFTSWATGGSPQAYLFFSELCSIWPCLLCFFCQENFTKCYIVELISSFFWVRIIRVSPHCSYKRIPPHFPLVFVQIWLFHLYLRSLYSLLQYVMWDISSILSFSR